MPKRIVFYNLKVFFKTKKENGKKNQDHQLSDNSGAF